MNNPLNGANHPSDRTALRFRTVAFGVILLFWLSACQTLAPLPAADEANILKAVPDWFVFSNGALLSLNLPRHDLRLNRAPQLKLEEIEAFGEVFMVRADKPLTLKARPHLFEMAMNVVLTDSVAYASYLEQRTSSKQQRALSQGGLSWECDNFTQYFEARPGRRWVCIAQMNPTYTLLVYGKTTQWISIGQERLDYWESAFFASLDTIQLSKP